jgi:hypothetical protein
MDSDNGKRETLSRWGWYAACAGLVIFYFFNVLTFFDYTQDDPGITFRYGANLFDGKGLVYNGGDRVEGYSNFGFVVLMGLVCKLLSFLDHYRYYVIAAAKFINLAAGLATLFFCYRFSRDFLKKERYIALLTAFLVAANGAFVINVSSPMETATYSLLLMMVMFFLSRYQRDIGAPMTGVLVLGFVFSIWRIDAPVLVAGFFLAFLLARRFRVQRRDWLLLVGWLALYGGYTAFRLLYFGQLLNNPFYAKVAPGMDVPILLSYTDQYFMCLGDNSFLFLVIFLLAVALDYERYLLPLVLIATQWAYIAVVNGDWMPGFRFWAPLTPCMAFLLVGAIDQPFKGMSARLQSVLKTLLIAAVAFWWAAGARNIYELGGYKPYRFFNNFRTMSLVSMNPYWPTARWLEGHAQSNTVIAVQEGGFIPFLTNLKAIESYGLCNKELTRVPGNRGKLGLKVTWQLDDPGTRWIINQKPDFLIIGPSNDYKAPQTLFGNYALVPMQQASMFIYVRKDSPAVIGVQPPMQTK